jgi:hypothetical protein
MKRFLRSKAVVVLIAGLTVISLAAGCKKQPKAIANPANALPAPELHALSGKVAETMNAGGYTYVLLEKNGEKTWVAVKQMPVKKGQEMAFQPGFEMKNFTSKTLKRTFKSIYFSGGLLGAEMKGGNAMEPSGKAAPAEKISVAKASGPDAYTIGELFAKKALKDKTVVVRAKVVKASSMLIMGKYWIHLQDGTGDAKNKTNELVATASAPVKAGAVVVAKGNISRDKDFGSGYKYDVIMEDATFQK